MICVLYTGYVCLHNIFRHRCSRCTYYNPTIHYTDAISVDFAVLAALSLSSPAVSVPRHARFIIPNQNPILKAFLPFVASIFGFSLSRPIIDSWSKVSKFPDESTLQSSSLLIHSPLFVDHFAIRAIELYQFPSCLYHLKILREIRINNQIHNVTYSQFNKILVNRTLLTQDQLQLAFVVHQFNSTILHTLHHTPISNQFRRGKMATMEYLQNSKLRKVF